MECLKNHEYFNENLDLKNSKILLDSNYVLNDIQIQKREVIKKGTSEPIKYTLKVSDNDHQKFEEYPIIFKEGDDLRKDHLMLQVIKLIQKVI
jgi:phosphatidylinositol kinase/protein kinase (PI-3  family)